MRLIWAMAGCMLAAQTGPGPAATTDHARVTHTGIDAKQASAIAETLTAARAVYVDQFAFDMPEHISATVTCGPDQPTRLYTDGQDRVYLSMPSKDKLV